MGRSRSEAADFPPLLQMPLGVEGSDTSFIAGVTSNRCMIPLHLWTRFVGGPVGSMCAVVAFGCSPAYPKRLDYGLYPSAAMQRDMHYSVYKPPAWTAAESLPLVVLLHGAGDDPRTPDSVGVGQVLDAAIQSGSVPRTVITWPQGDLGFWENWANGERRYRDWVNQELIPHVSRRYHTRDCPEGCHLMGISMGGAGALSFVLAEPQQWRSVSVLSAPVYNIDEIEEMSENFWLNLIIPTEDIWGPFSRERAPQRNVYTRWQQARDVGTLSLLFTWGSQDSDDIRRSNRRLEAHFAEREIHARMFEFDGDHSWDSWLRVLPQVIQAQVPTN